MRRALFQPQHQIAMVRKPQSVAYWLREQFARNKDVKQATSDVIAALVASGMFEDVTDLKCPNTGDGCRAVRLADARVAQHHMN